MRWWLGCENRSGATILQLRDDTGVTATITSTTVITDGPWHHLAANLVLIHNYLRHALVAHGISGCVYTPINEYGRDWPQGNE
jgi:hypothetical protein